MFFWQLSSRCSLDCHSNVINSNVNQTKSSSHIMIYKCKDSFEKIANFSYWEWPTRECSFLDDEAYKTSHSPEDPCIAYIGLWTFPEENLALSFGRQKLTLVRFFLSRTMKGNSSGLIAVPGGPPSGKYLNRALFCFTEAVSLFFHVRGHPKPFRRQKTKPTCAPLSPFTCDTRTHRFAPRESILTLPQMFRFFPYFLKLTGLNREKGGIGKPATPSRRVRGPHPRPDATVHESMTESRRHFSLFTQTENSSISSRRVPLPHSSHSQLPLLSRFFAEPKIPPCEKTDNQCNSGPHQNASYSPRSCLLQESESSNDSSLALSELDPKSDSCSIAICHSDLCDSLKEPSVHDHENHSPSPQPLFSLESYIIDSATAHPGNPIASSKCDSFGTHDASILDGHSQVVLQAQTTSADNCPILQAIRLPFVPFYIDPAMLPHQDDPFHANPPSYLVQNDTVYNSIYSGRVDAFETYAPLPNIQSPVYQPIVAPMRMPGPFVITKHIQSGAYGQTVAVMEAGGISPAPLLCLKVFKKKYMLEGKVIRSLTRELLAYKRMEEVEPRRKSIFLMTLDASLQDEKRFFFAMVST